MFRRYLLICLVVTHSPAVAEDISDVGVVNNYTELMISGNHESAIGLWSENALERAGRFPIQYEEVILKIDATSPLALQYPIPPYFLNRQVRRSEFLLPGKFYKIEFSAQIDNTPIKQNYFTQNVDGTWWLVFPQDFYGRDWKVVESQYYRIHAHPDVVIFLNPVVLEAADNFVEQMADSLKLHKEDLKLLKARKVEFWYCDTDSTVELITGQPTRGVLDLASNDIISSSFPHYHELLHLLVNIKLRTIPLRTLPIFREGVAVYYGGRWGKMPSALMDLGAYLYTEDLVELDSLLTIRGFDTLSGADINYPVAGIFTAYLRQKLGLEGYFGLYRKVSARIDSLSNLRTDHIKGILTTACEFKDWDDMVKDFNSFLTKQTTSHVYAAPGRVSSGKVMVKADGWTVTEGKEWLAFEYSAPQGDTARSSILFGADARLRSHASDLYRQQFGEDSEYEGYRYVVRVDQNEAGLYDLGSNHLVAKYIWGITPSPDYFDSAANMISIRFKRSLLDGTRLKKTDYKIVNQ